MAYLRLLVGLGNPGSEYVGTRHNIGFMVLDRLAQQENLAFTPASKWNCTWARWGEIIVTKPMTYMNRSGDSVGAICHYFRIQVNELLLVVDDVALPLGRLRLRSSGSDGGHNGLKSIIACLGTDFPRLRIGIGAATDSADLVDHVLSTFSKPELEIVSRSVERATEAIRKVAEEGVEAAMNIFNRAENIDTL
jgi:peptidyl-tRNA hydrolase, PTH1 family